MSSKQPAGSAVWISALAFGVVAIIVWQLWSEWSGPAAQATVPPEPELVPATSEPVSALPRSVALDARKVALGNLLFHDKRFARDDSVACASCHALDRGGVDGLQRSIGVAGQTADFNAPTVLNSGFNFKQFWDGRADTLEQQVDGPLHHPKEFGSSWSAVLAKLGRDPDYRRRFAELYADGVQVDNVKDAIATFERSLVTPDSRFDRHLRGDADALTPTEVEGYRLFKNYGCVACHQGVNVGGNMFARFGVMRNYFKDRGQVRQADLGRFNVTGDPAQTHVFKVPSLRNIALTAPYFHDGSAQTLAQAVGIMGQYQLGVTIPPQDVARIVAFLNTLTGEYRPRPQ